MRANPTGNSRTVNNQPLPGQVPPSAGIPTQAGANPAVTIARESFENRVAYWVENISYAVPFVVMALSPSWINVGAAFMASGFAAMKAQEYQQNVGGRGPLVPSLYIGLGGAMLVKSQTASSTKSDPKAGCSLMEHPTITDPKAERLVRRLQKCPAGLALWNKAQNEMKGTFTVSFDTRMPKTAGEIVISGEPNRVERMSVLIDKLCTRAIFPEWTAIDDRAKRGDLSREDYFIERGKNLHRDMLCWDEVVDTCAKAGHSKYFPKGCRDYDPSPEAFKAGLAKIIADSGCREYCYRTWDADYKAAFCERSPDHADCSAAM